MSATDQELIAAALSGRLEAYDELMERYQRLVYKLAFGYTRSHESALDLTQTVFLQVYKRLRSFHGKSHFKTWLMRVASNESVSWVRANRRHLDGRESLTGLAEIPVSEGHQEKELVRRERREQLLGGLAGVSERYRTAILLRYFNDLSVREVASVLQCSEGTAKNVLFRGVKRLRQRVAQA